jgi:uncharacterized protein (DUF934 family)
VPHDVVIRNRQLEPDPWRIVGLAPEERESALPHGAIVVPLALWKERRGELLRRLEPIGVWLEPDQDPAEIAADLPQLALVAVRFPKFTDGRGYSLASLLRRRHGYRGELRAFGDIGRDQLFYLSRVGFDSFLLPEHRDPAAALGGFHDFTVRYQGSVDDPQPLFRKRALGAEASRGPSHG